MTGPEALIPQGLEAGDPDHRHGTFSDLDTDSDMPALNGAAVALAISDIPFCGPVAAVRVGKVDGQLLINPTNTQLKESTLNIIVAGAPQGLVMVEGGAKMASEEEILEALSCGDQTPGPA